MKFKITKFQIFILTWIARKIVVRSEHRQNNIICFFEILNEEAKKEIMHMDGGKYTRVFLTDCFEKSLHIGE